MSLFSNTTTVCRYFTKKPTDNTAHFIFHRPQQKLSESKNCIHNFEMQNQKNNKTCFTAYLYSAGTHYQNMHRLSVTTRRVTYFILRAHMRAGVSHRQHRKTLEKFWKNAGEWTGMVEISKGEIPGSRRRMHDYIRTCSRLSRRTIELWLANRWVFNFCVRSTPLRLHNRLVDTDISEEDQRW